MPRASRILGLSQEIPSGQELAVESGLFGDGLDDLDTDALFGNLFPDTSVAKVMDHFDPSKADFDLTAFVATIATPLPKEPLNTDNLAAPLTRRNSSRWHRV